MNLKSLILGDNALTGSIPATLGDIEFLETLQLSSNQLSGPIPSAIGRLEFLGELDLSYNTLAGTLPSTIGNMQFLETLRLNHNSIAGPLPSELGGLSSLTILDLSHNHLSGSADPVLNITTLETLQLSDNQFSGSISIPEPLTALRELRVAGNRFSGSITLPNRAFPNLSVVDLSRNMFSEDISPLMANSDSLTQLWIQDNQFSGSLSPEIIRSTNLVDLRIQNNQFDQLPDLTVLPMLDTLDVSDNTLSFEDLELISSLTGLGAFTYAPQDSIDTGLRRTDTQLKVFPVTGGVHNGYQWFENGVALPNETGPELIRELANVPITSYSVEVTNSQLPDLTLISRPIASDAVDTAIELVEVEGEALQNALLPNYPNPAASATRIPFVVQAPLRVRIMMYDLVGRAIQMLVDRDMDPGHYEIDVDTGGLAPGIYYYRAEMGDFQATQQLVIVR